MEHAFGLVGLSVVQRSNVAMWLLEGHPTEVNDGSGTQQIMNFVFGGLELVYDGNRNLDKEESTQSMPSFFQNVLIIGTAVQGQPYGTIPQ